MKTLRFFAVALCLCILATVIVFADTQQESQIVFSDVAQDAPYAAQVQKLVENGVLSGYEDGTFRPEGPVTRAEMCKMVTLSFGLTDIEGAQGFADISEKDWFFPYALAAQKAGIVDGFEDGTFRGYEKITREQVCAILVRVLKPFDLPIEVTVNDKISDWAKPYVLTILKNQLMKTDENGNFRATEVIKRHELATTVSVFVVDPAQPIKANVKFFVGNEQYGHTQEVICGEFATLPENPTAPEGFKFDGWKIQGTEDVIEADYQRIFTDLNFEAVFVQKSYSVKFYDGQTLMFDTTVLHGDAPTNPALSDKQDNAFVGWSLTNGGKAVDMTIQKIISDTSFYAVFEDDESTGGSDIGGGGTPSTPKPPKDDDEEEEKEVYYTVMFYNGTDIHNQQKVLKDDYATAPAKKPTRDGFVFDGWSDTEDGGIVDVEDYVITKNTSFYACFSEKEYVENPNSEELMYNLNQAYTQLSAIRMSGRQKRATKHILNCLNQCIEDANNGVLITMSYVEGLCPEDDDETYKEKAEAEIRAMGDDATAYYNLITSKTDDDVETFLLEYFGIDLSQYI